MDDNDISYRIPEMIEAARRRFRIVGYCAIAIVGAFLVWRISH